MTDYEPVEAAERLIYKSDLKQPLPPHHTLMELADTSEAVTLLAKIFFKKNRDRLKSLAPTLYRELETWE